MAFVSPNAAMIENGSPKMAIIVLTPDCYETIRQTMSSLHAQTVRDQLEIILVVSKASRSRMIQGKMELKSAEFKRVHIVEVDSMNSTAAARAAGVQQATAPVVAFTEDHSYPDPHWAESLIAAHRGPWAAVGPAMCNANPQSALSWVNFATEYAPWLHPVSGGPVDHLPGHNSSYKRHLLLAYGRQLEVILEAESVLHWELRAKGHQLYLEPAAKTFHLNYSVIIPTIRLRFLGGRLFAASRARSWSTVRRLLYCAGSPLIPLVRLRRIWRALRRARTSQPLPANVLPVLAFILACDAAGEMIGYLFGSGQAMRKLSEMEFHRYRFMSRQDQRVLGLTQNFVPVSE